MRADLNTRIEQATGSAPVSARQLGGGCISDVSRIELADGRSIVTKTGDADSGLAIEGWMLEYLKSHSALPVPDVIAAEDTLLILSHIETSGGLDANAQTHAGEIVAALHGITGDAFGFERDTVIGGLHQPNPKTPRWLDFFRDQRLMYMGEGAVKAGRLPAPMMARVERLAGQLDRWITEPAAPALIHGDMWTGNVLAHQGEHGGRIAGFIDPAIYYADPEIELAFTTLFDTFTEPFFKSYQRHRPIAAGFFEERCALYNLYPLLVHVRLFGGSYVGQVERTLTRFGF